MKHPNRHGKQSRRVDAIERNDAWKTMSPEAKLASLDARLGAGKGATKQRERILSQMKSV